MCYICEARGTVGVGYRAAQKEITGALRVYTYKHCPDRNCCATTHGNKQFRKPWMDYTRTPSKKLWSNADLKEYGKEWRREHFLP